MVAKHTEQGFTVAEMVVTLVIISLFLTLFFQLYLLSNSQRSSVTRLATANDIAMTNLRKISAKSLIPASTTPCDNNTNGSSNPNNRLLNPSLPSLSGSTIAATNSATNPWTSLLTAEPITGTGMPIDTIQSLIVSYPRGCSATMPAKIISIVTYGSESIARASYAN